MSMNFRDSSTLLERTRSIATGSTVTREGLVLVGVLEGGVEVVKPATGASGEAVVGFSKLDSEALLEDVKVEVITVPSSSPYVVTLAKGNLYGSGPISYEVRVEGPSADWPQDATPDGDDFAVTDASSGELTFHSSNAGDEVTVYYRFELLASEAIQVIPGQRSVNNTAAQFLRQVVVKGGKGEVFTKEFDATADFTTGTLKTLADGKITMGGSGTDLTALGWRVIKTPDTNDGFLGLAINTSL